MRGVRTVAERLGSIALLSSTSPERREVEPELSALGASSDVLDVINRASPRAACPGIDIWPFVQSNADESRRNRSPRGGRRHDRAARSGATEGEVI